LTQQLSHSISAWSLIDDGYMLRNVIWYISMCTYSFYNSLGNCLARFRFHSFVGGHFEAVFYPAAILKLTAAKIDVKFNAI